MEKKTYLLSFDYEDGFDKSIEQVFNADQKKIIDSLRFCNLSKNSFSSILLNIFESNKLSGNELMFLATVGLKSIIEESQISLGIVSIENIDELKKIIMSMPEKMKDQVIKNLPPDIREKLGL